MINRLIPLIILLVVGCATPREFIHTTSFVFDTNPQGATVICDGQDAGYAPIVFYRSKNSDLIGENRPLKDEEIAEEIEITKIQNGELKVGETKVLTDEQVEYLIYRIEVEKIVYGELKVGENTVLTDSLVKGLIEATKIVDGELDIGEYTASINAEEMQTAIQLVKKIKEEKGSTCTAYWSSGVSKKYPSTPPYNYAGNGKFIYTLQRPEGAGYSQDAEFALKVKQLKQDQQTANQNASIAISAVQAQQRAAQAQERAASVQERAATSQAYQNNKSTSCYTNFGITTCY